MEASCSSDPQHISIRLHGITFQKMPVLITDYFKSELTFTGDDRGLIDGSSRRNSLRLQESQPKSLAIEVVSSQSKVSVSVDGTTVSPLKDSIYI
jgi:hypothetical protein